MSTEPKFNEIKTEILARAKEADACAEQYCRAYKSESLAELMQVVKDNFGWAYIHEVITPSLIKKYRAEFAENNIRLNVDANSGFILCHNAAVEASGDAAVFAWGNASVKAWGNAAVKAWGNAAVKAYDNAAVEASGDAAVEAWDNAAVFAWGNAAVKAYDNAAVEAWGNAAVEAWGNAAVKAWGNASVKASGCSYTTSFNKIKCKLSGNAIYRVKSENTIYYASEDIEFVKQ